MGSVVRFCARCDLTKVTGTRIECRSCGDDTSKHKGFEWQVRKFLEDHGDLKHFTYTDTALPCAAQNATNVRRADFAYVLKDRVVFLEVDENEHRHNNPECERKREQQLADSVTNGLYVVIIRYNPLAKGIPWFRNLEKLAIVLREAFVTEEVKLANDGIHRVYVGYQLANIRKLDAAYEEVQKGALKRAREDTTTTSIEERSFEEMQSVQAEPTNDSSKKTLINEVKAMKNEMKAMKKKITMIYQALGLLPEVKEREKNCVMEESSERSGADEGGEAWIQDRYELLGGDLDCFRGQQGTFEWDKLDNQNIGEEPYYLVFDYMYQKYIQSGNMESKINFGKMLSKLGCVKGKKRINGKVNVVYVGIRCAS